MFCADALVEVRDRQQRPLPGEVLGRRVVGVEGQVVDHPRLVAVEQFGEQPAAVDRQPVRLLPRVDRVLSTG